MAILEIKNIIKRFGGIVALQGVSLSVDKGGVVAIIGPNGSGKTTLLNVITGVYVPEEGEVLLNESPIQSLSPEKVCKKGISRTFQNIRLLKKLTVLENVMIGGHKLYKRGLIDIIINTKRYKQEQEQHKKRAVELLEFVGLEGKEKVKPENLPYASQRFLEIARALASEPQVLLLDEPAAGMNAVEIKHLIQLIKKISKTGITILLIEHIMDLVREVTDNVVVLSYGEKIAEGNYEDIEKNPVVIEAYLGKGAIKC
jgi:branched-chain amino acid transport system ATP-binding protein